MAEPEPKLTKEQASMFQAVKMVLSAFVGLRKQGPEQKFDVTPVQVVVAGLILAALFVFTVVSVVRLVTR
jgi:hypothetical protein